MHVKFQCLNLITFIIQHKIRTITSLSCQIDHILIVSEAVMNTLFLNFMKV